MSLGSCVYLKEDFLLTVSQGMPESKRLIRTGAHYLEEVNLVYFSKVLNAP